MNIKKLTLTLLLATTVTNYLPACTNLIVGKNASTDGSTRVWRGSVPPRPTWRA